MEMVAITAEVTANHTLTIRQLQIGGKTKYPVREKKQIEHQYNFLCSS